MGNQAVDRTTVIAVKPGIHHSLAVTRADAARHVPWRHAFSDDAVVAWHVAPPRATANRRWCRLWWRLAHARARATTPTHDARAPTGASACNTRLQGLSSSSAVGSQPGDWDLVGAILPTLSIAFLGLIYSTRHHAVSSPEQALSVALSHPQLVPVALCFRPLVTT
jgi:hypothetical protein